jgi:cation diffusion facilitator family transporter
MAPRSVAMLATRNILYASIAGDLIVAAVKIGAAAYTGSSAMWSEAVHSLVDSSNSILLLYGVHRSKRTPDQDHPFGYGREIYFWSFVVAVQVFALGAGVAFVDGVTHVLDPTPIEFAHVNYIVLGLSALFDGATWLIAASRVGQATPISSKRYARARTRRRSWSCSRTAPR